ncbi:MAG: hypothetical protein N2C12_17170, partial [Planctomycetales bacterium]
MPLLRLAISLLILNLTSIVDAETIYVSNVLGNDHLDGAKATPDSEGSGPFKTIEHALRKAHRGDQIVLHDSGPPYRDSITLSGAQNSGTAVLPFVFDGNGAILDGSVPIADYKWIHHSDNVYQYSPKQPTFIEIFRDDKPLTEVKLATDATGIPELQPLQWCLYQRKVYFRTEPEKTPD